MVCNSQWRRGAFAGAEGAADLGVHRDRSQQRARTTRQFERRGKTLSTRRAGEKTQARNRGIANLNSSIRVDPGCPLLAPKKRLWQGSALAPSRNPVTQR